MQVIMNIKTICGGMNREWQWWNLSNSTMLLYNKAANIMLKVIDNEHWVVLKATLKRNDIPAFIEGYLSELNNINHGSTNSK